MMWDLAHQMTSAELQVTYRLAVVQLLRVRGVGNSYFGLHVQSGESEMIESEMREEWLD